MNCTFHPSARLELLSAVAYYEDCRTGLGTEFAQEVYSALQRIRSFPEAWSSLSANTRRCLVNRFPYGVVYQVRERDILIVALMQLNREPRTWHERTV